MATSTQAQARTRNDIAERRVRVARLRSRGLTQAEIAQVLKVNAATISRDLAALRETWADEALTETDVIVRREIEMLEEVIREAWAQWERSKKDIRRSRTVTKPPAVGASGKLANQVETTQETTGRLADPRYLEQARKAAERISELYGVAKLLKVEHSGAIELGGLAQEMTPEDRQSLREFLRGLDAPAS
jgi:predicted transcriptional regulator